MREESLYVIYSELSQKQLLDLLLMLRFENDDDESSRRADVSLRNYACALRKYGPLRIKEINMAIADMLGADEKR